MSLNNNIFKPILLPHEGHIYLDAEDECYYFGEYTPRKGYAYSHINDDIYNLKKIPTRRSNPKEWKHKENTIRKVAYVLQSLIRKDSEITLIPIPPSKEKSDPLYDDRLLQILKISCNNWKNPDIRELIYQTRSYQAAHDNSNRPNLDEMISIYRVNEELAYPVPKQIAIFDDVITSGCHFKAMKTILSKRYPDIKIIGIFYARSILTK